MVNYATMADAKEPITIRKPDGRAVIIDRDGTRWERCLNRVWKYAGPPVPPEDADEIDDPMNTIRVGLEVYPRAREPRT